MSNLFSELPKGPISSSSGSRPFFLMTVWLWELGGRSGRVLVSVSACILDDFVPKSHDDFLVRMGINSLETEITSIVLARFVNLHQPTLRKDLVVKFKEPEIIDNLVRKSLLNRIDIAGKISFVPKLLAFHYCADPEVTRKAKTGIEIVLHVLKNLFELEEENKPIMRAEIEAHTNKMYDTVDPEQLKLGLYLIREFNVLRSYGTNAESTEINSLTIDESIVTLKDISREWDRRVWILNRYIENESASMDEYQSNGASLPSFEGRGFNWSAYPIIESATVEEPVHPSQKVPRAFISYSWDNAEHKRWVMTFASQLQKDGISVILDKWHLPRGGDKARFMEASIADSDFVILVCTPQYADRANQRKGGVGYEAMIITGELAEKIDSEKFIPILRVGEFESAFPAWIKTRLGVDLRGDPYAKEEYEDLVRTLHTDLISPPPLGAKPNWDIEAAEANPFPHLKAANEVGLEHWDVLARLASGIIIEGPNPVTARRSNNLLHISISAFTANFRERSSSVHYSSGSITIPYSNKTHYVFAMDPQKAGGAVSYQATPLLQEAMGRSSQIYIGRIRVLD